MRRWRLDSENARSHSEMNRKWRRENHDRILARNRDRRALLKGAGGRATPEQIEARMAFYGHRCVYCGGPFEHIDHVKPISRGGTNWPANLRPSCKPCNLSKHARTPDEWRAWQLEQRAA